MTDLGGERLEQFTGEAGKTGLFTFFYCALLDRSLTMLLKLKDFIYIKLISI